MLLTRTKVEPRNNQNRLSLLKNGLKSKLSLPENCSSAKALFQALKLTQSHEIQDLHTNEFQLNILPPSSSSTQSEPITKKFSSPEWLLASHMSTSHQTHLVDVTSENPQTSRQFNQTTQNEYENSKSQSEKTDSLNEKDLLKVNRNQIQRILQMTVSDDRERQMNETNLRSYVNLNDELESKSAFLCKQLSPDSDKSNHSTFDLRQAHNQSKVSHKPKSAIIRPSQNLDHFHKQQLEIFSQYGLKPYEQSRLRKIQELQKLELLKQQADNISANESEENQEYFNISRGKKTGGQMSKLRKCSAVVETHANERCSKEVSKKSLSKNKYSLSKGKKGITPKLMVKRP